MARTSTSKCVCLVPLSDLFAGSLEHRDAAVRREGWTVVLDHMDRPAIPAADALAFAAKRRDEAAAVEAERLAAAEAERARLDEWRQLAQTLFDEGFAQSRAADYRGKVEEARKHAAGSLYGRLSEPDYMQINKVTTSRGDVVILDHYPWSVAPKPKRWSTTIREAVGIS